MSNLLFPPSLRRCRRAGADINAARALEFQRAVFAWYKANGRHELPWRQAITPYKVVLSELMLQQTQAARVIPYFKRFHRAFPSWKSLAESTPQEVLQLWSGLGYNRRAFYLRTAAQQIREHFAGRFPKKDEDIRALPGVGSYTCEAIKAFVFDKPAVLIETNIRAVMHYFFRPDGASDAELLPLIEILIPKHPGCPTRLRHWYYALMDLGAVLKQHRLVQNSLNPNYRRQAAFQGSIRQLRGEIVRQLLAYPSMSPARLLMNLKCPAVQAQQALDSLIKEGMIRIERSRLTFAQEERR